MRAFVLLAGLLLLAVTFTGSPIGAQDTEASGHPANACSAPYHVSYAGWDFCWQQDNPRAQGLELNQVYFQGESVAWRMGVPFTLTKYDSNAFGPYKDTLGTPGSGGHPGYGAGALFIPDRDCPRFLADGVRLHNDRVCVEERDGPEPAVAIWSRFNIYNYRFIQGWTLDARGHIEPLVAMGGTLIDGNSGAAGQNHHHHLYWRVDYDIATGGNDQFESYGLPCDATIVLIVDCSVVGTPATWNPVLVEGKLKRNQDEVPKWRVKDLFDLNSMGRQKSYEFMLQSYTPADTFSTFDTMVVQYKGDSTEIGYEIPTNPAGGDAPLSVYHTPPETITDPVVWSVLHIYHDTRDEDRGSMSHHYAGYDIQPNNFFGSNPGESTYP